MRYSKELLKGSTPIIVMSVLRDGDLYGYRIIREIDMRSDNVFEMSEGTLYPILHSLEKGKLLSSHWETEEGRKRKYYHLTERGVKEYEKRKEEFYSYSDNVRKVLSFG